MMTFVYLGVPFESKLVFNTFSKVDFRYFSKLFQKRSSDLLP